jgi:hypothetical protein
MISITATKIVYSGDGSTLIFPYPFRIDDKAHLKVWVAYTAGVWTLLTLDSDYTVSDVGSDTGGNVTISATVPPSGITDNIVIERVTPAKQLVNLPDPGPFPQSTVERQMIDNCVMLIQELFTKLGTPAAGALLQWDARAQDIEASGTATYAYQTVIAPAAWV